MPPSVTPLRAAAGLLARAVPGPFSRRRVVRAGLAAAATAAGAALGACVSPAPAARPAAGVPLAHQHHTGDVALAGVEGMVKTDVGDDAAEKLARPEGFDPMAFLTAFDYGNVSKLPDGRTLREYEIVSFNKDVEVAPGVMF